MHPSNTSPVVPSGGIMHPNNNGYPIQSGTSSATTHKSHALGVSQSSVTTPAGNMSLLDAHTAELMSARKHCVYFAVQAHRALVFVTAISLIWGAVQRPPTLTFSLLKSSAFCALVLQGQLRLALLLENKQVSGQGFMKSLNFLQKRTQAVHFLDQSVLVLAHLLLSGYQGEKELHIR